MKNQSPTPTPIVSMKQKLTTVAFVAALLLTGVGTSFGQTTNNIAVANYSFETPVEPANSYGGPVGSGWTSTAIGGTCVFNCVHPGTTDGRFGVGNGSPVGMNSNQYCQIFAIAPAYGNIYLDIAHSFVNGATYQLTAAFGKEGGTLAAGAQMVLENNSGANYASTNILAANLITDQFVDQGLTWVASGASGNVRLLFTIPATVSANSFFDFDNIRLVEILPPGVAITNQPVSQSALPGQAVSFSVGATVSSGTPLTYQWQATNSAAGGFTNLVNGGQISGATTNVLTISNASVNNTLVYQVIVTNSLGSVTSSPVSLTVNSSELIDVDVGQGPVQTGAAVLGTAGDVAWNSYASVGASSLSNLKDSGGNILTGVGLNVSAGLAYGNTVDANLDPATTPLMQDFLYSSTSLTTSVTGLTAYKNDPYTLVVYAAGTTYNGQQAALVTVTAGSSGTTPANGIVYSYSRSLTNSPGGLGVAYQTFTGILTNSTLTFALTQGSNSGVNLNGFQLQVQIPNPGIASQPVSSTNVVNTTAQFSVVASGNTPFTYQWQEGLVGSGGPYTNLSNGGGISGSTSNVLTLASLTPSESLDYVVIVTNSFGSITSSPATLTVLTIPDITNNPVSQTVLAGSAVTYTVGASGVGTLTYQWQATNSALGGFTNIVGATTNILTLSSVSSNSATFYQVVVGNLNGSVTSVPAGLTVLPSTTLVDVQFDGVYNLSTATAGLGPVQTGAAVLGASGDQWTVENVVYYTTAASLLSGVPLTNTTGTANGMTLTVGQTNTPANPVYTATYNNTTVDPNTTNLMSSLLESFNYYKSPQAFSISIGGLSLYTNEAFTLVIYAADPNAPVTETLTITGGATNGNTAAAVTTSSTSLSLTNSPGGAGVSYNTFIGTLTNGTLSFNITGGGPSGHIGINGFQLLVSPTVPPVITSEPVSQTNVVGSTVQFNVVAAAAGALTYHWQTNGVSVGTGGVFSGTTSNVLTLTSINTNDALAYQVVVTSGGNSVTSSPAANLTVLEIPLITTNPVSQTALSGGSATYTVAANGSGLTYQWQATNSALGGFTNIVGATTNTLTLTSVSTNNAAYYQVIVANGNGSVTSAPPAALNILPATELIDVDIGTSAGKQSGAAVLGAPGDIWNGVAAGGSFSPVVDTGSNIVAGVAVVPQAGVTSYNYNGTGGSAVDSGTAALMNDFMFSYNPSVPFTVSVTGLSPYINSPFALVVYSAMGANQGATISLAGATGGTSTNTVTTTGATKQLSLGIGVAYQIFTGVVTNGSLVVTLSANNDPNFHGCNGLQLLLSPTIPPIITNEPVSLLVNQGQSATFTVGVLATAPVTYQWQATNSALGGFTNIVGATTNVLNLASVTTNSASIYQVVVANGAGTVTSTPAILSIFTPPTPTLVGEWFTNANADDNGFQDLSGFQPNEIHDGYSVGSGTIGWEPGDAPSSYALMDAASFGGAGANSSGFAALAISNTVVGDALYQTTFDKDLTNALTIAFWAKYSASAAGVPFVSKNGTNAGWQFQDDPATLNAAFSLVGANITVTNLDATQNYADGTWHHFAGTWDGTAGVSKVYVDGTLVTNASANLPPITTPSGYRLVLGGRDNGGTIGNFFTGELFDVRIYDYAINAAQVTGLYLNQTPAVTISSNAYLTSLTLNPAGTLNPAFATNTFSYSATNGYSITPTVTVVDADLTATNQLIYNNTTNLLASGTPSSALSLTLGTPNVVKVQVTAQDGVTVQTYTVNVIEQPSLSPRPKLTNSVALGKLNLNWGGQYLGYRLLQQTNNLNKGVSTNLTDWGTVAGTASLTATNITILKTNLDEYYRLVYP